MVLGDGPLTENGFSAVASPLRADGQRPALRTRPPRLGEHGREVLASLGLGDGDIDSLVQRGVVGRDAQAPAAASPPGPV